MCENLLLVATEDIMKANYLKLSLLSNYMKNRKSICIRMQEEDQKEYTKILSSLNIPLDVV